MEYLTSIPKIRRALSKQQPMTRTAMAKMVAKELQIIPREAFRLVNNCIRDGVIVAVEWPRKEKERRGIPKWIVVRNIRDVEMDNEELDRFYDEKYRDAEEGSQV